MALARRAAESVLFEEPMVLPEFELTAAVQVCRDVVTADERVDNSDRRHLAIAKYTCQLKTHLSVL